MTALSDGTHYPNVPGATTLADARPLRIGGERVTVTVRDQGNSLTLLVGTRIEYQGFTPADVRTFADIGKWAASYVPAAPRVPNSGSGEGQGLSSRERVPLHTAFGAQRTLRRWAAHLTFTVGYTISATGLRHGIRKYGSLEAYFTRHGLTADDINRTN
ncbi:hypothetical protein ACFZAM_31890 [Streptomyces sp. NPDC008079]|uniref:hypothetical protein n=1 Tax=Streptomyces sp. NPDC008079 TaxID=3364806 RepID=UPI0036E388AD